MIMLASPTFMAIFNAEYAFQGREWRRIKREVNKALKAVRK